MSPFFFLTLLVVSRGREGQRGGGRAVLVSMSALGQITCTMGKRRRRGPRKGKMVDLGFLFLRFHHLFSVLDRSTVHSCIYPPTLLEQSTTAVPLWLRRAAYRNRVLLLVGQRSVHQTASNISHFQEPKPQGRQSQGRRRLLRKQTGRNAARTP